MLKTGKTQRNPISIQAILYQFNIKPAYHANQAKDFDFYS